MKGDSIGRAAGLRSESDSGKEGDEADGIRLWSASDAAYGTDTGT